MSFTSSFRKVDFSPDWTLKSMGGLKKEIPVIGPHPRGSSVQPEQGLCGPGHGRHPGGRDVT